ncbi:MAG TPA: radical SAM family heme chaperone HemW [Chitinophagaceae bacterium]|nr:radical SAM family heme chaperone HemW [Chitinophagaceae bacterium]
MAGIYFHIPFCKQACTYCDFHFSTQLGNKQIMLDAIKKELHLQKNYLADEEIETIYFGGGTPSILEKRELSELLEEVNILFSVASDAEITLEANPDNLNISYLKDLKSLGINRLSIGIQSFFDHHLKWMNRTHTAHESEKCVLIAQDIGFNNISIDLIFGFPQLSEEEWKQNLKKAIALEVPHISSYSMAVSPKTAIAHQIAHNKMPAINEEESAKHFLMGKKELIAAGFDHYEISSFSKIGMQSKHNSNYWKGIPYLGIGPSAHSFNGQERQWNIRNNAIYINKIQENIIPAEIEKLSISNQLNEQILTQLRMKDGINLDIFEKKFGKSYVDAVLKDAKSYLQSKMLLHTKEQYLKLSTEGQLYADIIASDLFQ